MNAKAFHVRTVVYAKMELILIRAPVRPALKVHTVKQVSIYTYRCISISNGTPLSLDKHIVKKVSTFQFIGILNGTLISL